MPRSRSLSTCDLRCRTASARSVRGGSATARIGTPAAMWPSRPGPPRIQGRRSTRQTPPSGGHSCSH